MRKFIVWMLPLLLFLSCEKQQEQPFKIVVGVSPEDSKTQLGPKGANGKYPVYWQAGDIVSINGLVSAPLQNSQAGGASATFVFQNAPAPAAVYNVICPGTAATDKIVFPAAQNYVEGSYDRDAAPLIGHTESLASGVTLSTPAAIVRFVFTGKVTLTGMEIVSLGGEKISGEFTLGKDASGAFTGAISPSSTAGDRIDYSFGGGLTLTDEGFAVLFTLPSGTYGRGLRALVREQGGSTMTLRFFASGATLSPANVCAFPPIAYQAGKEILLTGTESLTGEDTDLEETAGNDGMDAQDATPAASIKVGSYNIWAPSARYDYWNPAGSKYDGSVSEQRSWANSYESVAAMINWLDCDVIGIQEVTRMVYQTTLTSGNADYDGNVHTLNSLVPGYSWVIYNAANTTYDNNWPKNTTANGLGSTDAILYKSSVLTLVSHGRHWLTGTRKKAPGDDSSWDRIGTNRPATWAKFTHKASGKQFVFITTHLDLPNAGETQDPAFPQRRNATELIEWFAPLVCGSLPSVITGDMNVDKGDVNGNYLILTSGRWQDVYDTMKAEGSLPYTDLRLPGTMNANKNETGGASTWRPDHVLCDGFSPSYYKVGREQFSTKDGSLHWPSDHFPVKVILNF